jgi:hypothetical protein
MKTFKFIIIASGVDPEADDFADRFYKAGCDDALVGGSKGRIIIDFSREAPSIEEAIASAVENVKAAGATVEHIEPDPLVNLSDVAERTGLTRAAISQYSTGARAEGFPSPVARIATATPLWNWPDVAVWLYRHERLPKDTVVEALAVKASNTVLSIGSIDFGRALKEHVEEEKRRRLLEA